MSEMPVGQLIRLYRLDRKLSQVGLATHAEITARYLEMIEAGTKTPSLPVLRRLAQALRVRTSALIGELPNEDTGEPATFRLAEVERALCTYPSVALTDRATPDLAELTGRIADAWQVWTHASAKYSLVLEVLPDLITDVELACAATSASPPACTQAVEVYQLARAVCKHAGRPDLGRMIADRAMRYAETTGDPALIGIAHWSLAQTMLTGDLADSAHDLSMLAIDRLEPHLGNGGLALWSVYGGLIHGAAIGAARTGDPWKAKNLLRGPARRAAERVGPGHNFHHLAFGPTNVAIHMVSIAAETGETGDVIRMADEVDLTDTGLSLERRTSHLYQVARAYEYQGNDTAVLVHLTAAERLCPEDFRYKRPVRSMVTALVRRAKASYMAEVREFAARVGVLD